MNVARVVGLAAAMAVMPAAFMSGARAEDIVIAGVYASTGPLESYGRSVERGFMLGLEYATKGTMEVEGRKIKLIRKDTQSKPERAKELLTEAYEDDGAIAAVSGGGTGEGIAMIPVALGSKRILMFASPTARSITGPLFNRYVFRTMFNSNQLAVSNAMALSGPDVSIAVIAQDNAYGREIGEPFKAEVERRSGKVVLESYVDPATKDFTGAAQRLFEALKDRPGRKIIWTSWAGNEDPIGKIKALQPERLGIELAAVGNTLPLMVGYKSAPGLIGATPYYYGIPNNPMNDWAVKTYQERYKEPPDFNTPVAMAAAISLVEALRVTKSTDVEKLIGALEGMRIDTPKGEMVIRKEDHQALQAMYVFKIKADPAVSWGVPELVREIPLSEIDVPIENRK